MKNCKIVEDLLPNYIDNLTSKETNEFIEAHLESCENCKKKLESMKSEIKLDAPKRDGREVKFAKKINKRLKILRFIVIVIIIAIITFIALTLRKASIISDLSEKGTANEAVSNYKKTTVTYDSKRDVLDRSESYILGNKIYVKLTTINNDSISVHKIYYNLDDGTANAYIEENGNKRAILNTEVTVTVNIPNIFTIWGEPDSKGTLKYALQSRIKLGKYNGKECYHISFYNSGENYYIEKETGLVIKYYDTEPFDNGDYLPDVYFKYEFDNVTEDDFIEPDISEYTIVDE